MRKTALPCSLSLLLLLSVGAFGQSSTFTYQGQLNDAASPATGNYDFTFRLFDVQAGGTQIGSDVLRDDVSVAGGLFTVSLDFGSSPFTSNTGYFLEISVRSGASTGSYTLLNPRQFLSSTPYSIQTVRAQSAATADNATALGGIAASQFVQTSDTRLTDDRNPTAGSANYIQANPAAPQASTSFNIGGNGTLGGTLSANQVSALQVTASGSNGVRTNRIDANLTGQLLVGSSNSTLVSVGTSSFTPRVEIGGIGTSSNSAYDAISINGNTFFNQKVSVFGDLQVERITARLTGGTVQIGSSGTAAISITKPTTISSDLSVTGTLNATIEAGSISGVLPIASGGTGSTTQNFIDLSTNQTVGGNKTFSGAVNGNQIVGTSISGTNVSGETVDAVNQFNLGGMVILSAPFGINLNLGRNVAPTSFGGGNAFIGDLAGFSNSIGNNNAFFGQGVISANQGTGYNNTSGSFNVFFGHRTGETNTIGNSNSFVGTGAGFSNSSGNENTFLGHDAGNTNSSGSFNTAVGTNSDVGAGNLLYATAIGSEAVVLTSDTIVLGKAQGTYNAVLRPADRVHTPGNLTVNGNLGVGTTSPTHKLTVNGSGMLTTGVTIGSAGTPISLSTQTTINVPTSTGFAANSCSTFTGFDVAANVGSPVAIGVDGFPNPSLVWSAYIITGGQVLLRVCNVSTSSVLTTETLTFNLRVFNP